MTLRFMDGFDKYGTDKTYIQKLWDVVDVSNVSTTLIDGRFPSASIDNPSHALSIYGTNYIQKNISGSFYWVKVGTAINIQTLADTNGFLIFKSNATDVVGLSINSAGRIIFHTGAEQNITPANKFVESFAGSITSDTWYYLEVFVKMDSTPTQVFEVYLNGTQLISHSADETSHYNITGIKLFGLYTGFFGTANIKYDDLYIKAILDDSETSGTASINKVIGSAKICTLLPTDTIDRDAVADQTGSSNPNVIFNAINEIPPDDDNTYIEITNGYSTNSYGLGYYFPYFSGSNVLTENSTLHGFSNVLYVKNSSGSNQDLQLWLENTDTSIMENTSSAGVILTTDYKYVTKVYDNNVAEQSFPANISPSYFTSSYRFGFKSGSYGY